MALRTPSTLTNPQTLVDLQRMKERMGVLQEQLTTGKRVVRLGDDPTASALVMNLQASISRNTQSVTQITAASSFLTASETPLQSLDTTLTRMLELGQQGLTGTMSATARANSAQEVDGLRNDTMDMANSAAQGKYLFAGTNTTTQPFSKDAAGNVLYSGNNQSIDLDVSISASVSTNLPGDSVFFGGAADPTTHQGTTASADIFVQMANLRDGLSTNNTAMIQSAYDNLKQIQSRLSTSVTELGGRQNALTNLKDNLSSYNLSLQSIQGSYEDVDYPSAIMEFYSLQTSQNAALSSLAKSNRQNLFDYLG